MTINKHGLHFSPCLRGSEPFDVAPRLFLGFLSCLLGSELVRRQCRRPDRFLSCLRGSEPRAYI
ncbi:hypothetical protein [Alloalcanivorax xenomutans]|uniref:hypothetical protein n=1 Tax=Alloalcanivorax xenomutans TaxID=1094342 RepID=UPI0040436D73